MPSWTMGPAVIGRVVAWLLRVARVGGRVGSSRLSSHTTTAGSRGNIQGGKLFGS